MKLFRGQVDDDRARFAGLCEFEALAGDEWDEEWRGWPRDEDDGLWAVLYAHINGGRRYRRGFHRLGVCRRCGCTRNRACTTSLSTGCFWVMPNLCSHCDEHPARRRFRRARLGPEQARRLRAQWRRFRELGGVSL